MSIPVHALAWTVSGADALGRVADRLGLPSGQGPSGFVARGIKRLPGRLVAVWGVEHGADWASVSAAAEQYGAQPHRAGTITFTTATLTHPEGLAGPVWLGLGSDGAWQGLIDHWRAASFTTPACGTVADAVHRALTARALGAAGSPTVAAGGFEWTAARGPHVMGIVNATPDSFSDGGLAFAEKDAIARGLQLAAEGATLIDVGGESTRPGAPDVPVDEEIRRVVPVVRALARAGLAVSIDTRKATVARAALDAGAALVNDVSGLRFDPAMAPLIADAGALCCLMHSRRTPADMQQGAHWTDAVIDIAAALAKTVDTALAAGIAPARIVLDPGIGFGKRPHDNAELIAGFEALRSLGFPLLLGASRKSFIGALTEPSANVGERLPGSLAAATVATLGGALFIRVHDVAETVQAVQIARALALGHPGL
jgi:dihydropteroate synthase